MANVKFGLQYPGQSPEGQWSKIYEAMLDQAPLAEELGYDTITVPEHHFTDDGFISAPTTVLGALAGQTENINIGTNILILPLHHPLKVAENAAALDQLTNGRFVLGIGLGWKEDEFRAFERKKSDRVKYMIEGIEIIRKVLTEKDVSYEGKMYNFENVTVTPRPVQDSIPIWYGGQSEAAIRRSAHRTDAWIISNTERFQDISEDMEVYEEALGDAGRDPQQVHRPLRREVYVAESDEVAWEEVGEPLLLKYRETYGNYEDIGHVVDDEFGLEDLREHAEDRFIVGGPETVIEELEKYHKELEIDEFMMQMHYAGLDMEKTEKSMRIFAEDVMPHFKDN
jgi:probable F420-dependent oxidoreductase